MTEARKLVISVILIVVVLAGVGTWLTLGLRQAGQLEGSVEQKRRDLTTLQEKVAAVPELRQERQKLGSELDEYEAILPNDRELNKILDTLSEYQKKAGIEIRQVTPMRENKENKASTTSYRMVSYEIDLVGDYFSVVRFLNLLENHNRFIQVDSFSVKQKDENSLVNEITLRLSTFVYDPKAKTTPAAASSKGKPAPSASKKVTGAKKAPVVPFDLKTELAARFVWASNTSMRDPFTNPLTRRVNAAKIESPKETTAQRALTPEQERASADEVEKKLAEAEALLAQDKIDDAAKLVAETEFVRGQSFHDATVAQRALGLSRSWQRLDLMVRTAKGEKIYRLAEETYEKMLQAFNAEDYDEVFKLRASLDAVLGRELTVRAPDDAGRKGARGKSASPPPKSEPSGKDETKPAGEREAIHERLAEVVKACDALCARAEVRREFASVGIQIQGTFWSGRGDARKAAAIINGQMLTEGDVLKRDARSVKTTSKAGTAKPDGDIIVRTIDREKVVFAYKDELIPRSQFKVE